MSFRAAALLPATLLAGCISIGAEPPPSLLTLTPVTMLPAGASAAGNQASALALVEFDVPQKLAVTRVPVQVTDSEIAYLKDAVWVEPPARLLRRLIAETVRVRSGRVVIDGDDPGVFADTRLTGIVREFGYDAQTSSVVLRLDAVRAGEGSEVTTRRFEAVIPGIAPDVVAVGPALNQAANQVAAEVAAWVS